MRKFGSEEEEDDGQTSRPWGVGFMSNGDIVTSEYHGNRLLIFDSQGHFVRIVGGAGQVRNFSPFLC